MIWLQKDGCRSYFWWIWMLETEERELGEDFRENVRGTPRVNIG
jgi:hypothetical protein